MQLIGYGLPLTGLDGVAKLVQLALPVTSLVARISPFLKPVRVASKNGFGLP